MLEQYQIDAHIQKHIHSIYTLACVSLILLLFCVVGGLQRHFPPSFFTQPIPVSQPLIPTGLPRDSNIEEARETGNKETL